MSVYGKMSWSRLQILPESLEDLKKNLEEFTGWLAVSALSAEIMVKYDDWSDSHGLNRISSPRGELELYDKILDITGLGDSDSDKLKDIMVESFIGKYEDIKESNTLVVNDESWDFELSLDGLYPTLEDLKLNEDRLAFWFVTRKRVNLEDLDSQKESLAIKEHNVPFKLLKGDARKVIMANLEEEIHSDRKQFPVLVNLQNGRIYVGTTNKKSLEMLSGFFQNNFGVPMFGTTLTFGDTSTPWEMDLFGNILEENILDAEISGVADLIDEEDALREMLKNNPVAAGIMHKRTKLAEYSDEEYLLELHTGVSMSPKDVTKGSISTADCLTAWRFLKEFSDWYVFEGTLVGKSEDGPVKWKIDVTPNMGPFVVFKNLEISKGYLEELCDADSLEKLGYNVIVRHVFRGLEFFENLYIGTIMRVLAIAEDDADMVGIKPLIMSSEQDALSDITE